MHPSEERALESYRQVFGSDPEILASAPGRVNLIGEHTDYSEGWVLPCAINRRTAVAIGTGRGGLYSADLQELLPVDGCRRDSWAAYPRGVAWALAERGYSLPPFQAVVAGDVPLGAGLSSSAALEAATALALVRLAGLDLPRAELAMLCQRAENAFVGVECGIMDQMAALCGTVEAALLLDCRSLALELIPFHLAEAGLCLVVADTKVRRELKHSGYNQRRATVERASRILGVRTLRDARPEDLVRLSGEEQRRARHVVSENARVLAAAEALRRSDFGRLGRLLTESHHSLRDDFEVSTPELNVFVDAAEMAGALGARLTGAGFGGCALALVPDERLEDLHTTVEQRFAEQALSPPAVHVMAVDGGARIVEIAAAAS